MLVPLRKHTRDFTVCYADGFAFLYVDNVLTSQVSLEQTYTASYGE
jgi:hypothetical protein